MSLEPREVLHVEPPRLSFQLLGREIPCDGSKYCQIANRVLASWRTLTVDTSQGGNRRCKTVSLRPIVRTFPPG